MLYVPWNNRKQKLSEPFRPVMIRWCQNRRAEIAGFLEIIYAIGGEDGGYYQKKRRTYCTMDQAIEEGIPLPCGKGLACIDACVCAPLS